MSPTPMTTSLPGRRRAPVPRSTLKAVTVAAAAAFTTGCAFADDADPPEVQALEIVVDSPKAPDEPCLLNVDSVRAGIHPVIVISEQGPATVRMLDAAGAQVLELRPVSASEAGQASVRLDAGRYSVECKREGGASTVTTLDVKPARHGYEAPEDQPTDPGA